MKFKSYAKLFDTVQIDPRSFDDFRNGIKDDIFLSPATDKALRVTIAATHAGRITRNYGFYLPQKMKEGVLSFTENFGKPILIHHNSHNDPIGRIVGAKYIDTSGSLTRDSIQDGLIQELCHSKYSFIQLLDVVKKLMDSGLLEDSSFPGLGYIQLEANITDKDAIQKILDKRYLTVSVGATTDKAICSICKTDWTEGGGPCEHRPGKLYKDEDSGKENRCFIIAGDLVYDETSFVNVPADPYARVIHVNTGTLQDSPLVEESDSGITVCAGFCFQDSDTGGSDMTVENKDENNSDAEPTNPDNDLVEEPTEADKHYDEMVDFAYNLALVDQDEFEDKKLSPEARKKLSKGTFCKPGERKYPVNDCSHAKVAMAYAKKYNEPSFVLSCIRRKAKALGCPFSAGKKTKDGVATPEVPEFELEIDEILQDLETREQADSQAAQQDQVNQDQADQDSEPKPCENDELQKELDALKQELEDVKAERAEENVAFGKTLEDAKFVLADMAVKFEQISGKEIENTDESIEQKAALSIEDLLKKSEELSEAVDMKTVLEKVHDGMARVPDEVVTDPTTEGDTDPNENTNDFYSRVRATYGVIKEKKGLDKADAYLRSLLNSGLIKQDFFNPKS